MNEWTVAIGVDTHKRTHTAAALDRFGKRVGALEIEASSAGYQRLWQWASDFGACCFAETGSRNCCHRAPSRIPPGASLQRLRIRVRSGSRCWP